MLEQLAVDHELPALVLAWRRLSKLLSTYIEALPPLVDERTGRIHPTFNQTGAATGRLSATNPNVQNIPIRTEEGVRIREAFVPAEGNRLLSADYSQVELRILAHYSGDESLVDAFTKNEDIHRRTAAEVAGISPDEVTPEQRARAKAVNFGIIYGSSAFGLSNTLKIAAGEAQETIDAYFARYGGVRRFLDETDRERRPARLRDAPCSGVVATCPTSPRATACSARPPSAWRSTASSRARPPISSRRPWSRWTRRSQAALLGARVILQVHDELVFEAPRSEVDAVADLARETMQQVLSLRVPLVVDVGIGSDWREAH